ncbi:MAG TPA: selenoneine synthase SenA [Pyrinomonadaceae bacterium]|nr:selenoneine synthase SenA [Pyrinomonadaceae bacterium]
MDMETTNDCIDALRDARSCTLDLISDLNDEQMIGPRLDIVNPLRWEIGHMAWFQEYWLLRHLAGSQPLLASGDALYDSARVAHETRWNLPLPSKTQTLGYMQRVLDQILSLYGAEETKASLSDQNTTYFLSLATFHEDMHAEAITYTRQTLGYRKPRLHKPNNGERYCASHGMTDVIGDAEIRGGRFLLGSLSDQPFVFDNEMRAHEVNVEPFAIARTATTNAEFLLFVEDGGYERRELWSDEGWSWRQSVGAGHPVYWRFREGSWLRRVFDELFLLEDHLPVLHVNWFEADAYCRWAGRRLPTEAEWEMAASTQLNGDGASRRKRKYPWGDDEPTRKRANLDWRSMGCIDVRALPDSDSAFGCRQMIGNVWEWTASDFTLYPGFVAGPYKEYSEPWFGDHKVLRGGCWTTRSRLIHNTYRNFYKPDRRDVWAGFRTCRL